MNRFTIESAVAVVSKLDGNESSRTALRNLFDLLPNTSSEEISGVLKGKQKGSDEEAPLKAALIQTGMQDKTAGVRASEIKVLVKTWQDIDYSVPDPNPGRNGYFLHWEPDYSKGWHNAVAQARALRKQNAERRSVMKDAQARRDLIQSVKMVSDKIEGADAEAIADRLEQELKDEKQSRRVSKLAEALVERYGLRIASAIATEVLDMMYNEAAQQHPAIPVVHSPNADVQAVEEDEVEALAA